LEREKERLDKAEKTFIALDLNKVRKFDTSLSFAVVKAFKVYSLSIQLSVP